MEGRNERSIALEKVKGWRFPGEPQIWKSLSQIPKRFENRDVTEFRVLYGGKWRRVLRVERRGLAPFLRVI